MVTPPRSDALVFFGATGDLAYKKIFPALQALARRGRLECPIVGVAKSGSNLEQLIARSGFVPARAAALLVTLELGGWARQLAGQRWVSLETRARRA